MFGRMSISEGESMMLDASIAVIRRTVQAGRPLTRAAFRAYASYVMRTVRVRALTTAHESLNINQRIIDRFGVLFA